MEEVDDRDGAGCWCLRAFCACVCCAELLGVNLARFGRGFPDEENTASCALICAVQFPGEWAPRSPAPKSGHSQFL